MSSGKTGSGDFGSHIFRKENTLVLRFCMRDPNDPLTMGRRVKVGLRTKDPTEAAARRDVVFAAFHNCGLLSARLPVAAWVEFDQPENGGRNPGGESEPGQATVPAVANHTDQARGAARVTAGCALQARPAEAPALSTEARLARLEAVHAAEVGRLGNEVERLQIQVNNLRKRI
jgi:hypothetical protein